jgi:hypothetical protein
MMATEIIETPAQFAGVIDEDEVEVILSSAKVVYFATPVKRYVISKELLHHIILNSAGKYSGTAVKNYLAKWLAQPFEERY